MDKGVIRMLTELEQLGKPKRGLVKVFDDVDSFIFGIRLHYIRPMKRQLKYAFGRKGYLVSGSGHACSAVLFGKTERMFDHCKGELR